jgi:hypothetical protein|nr:MAG TPA: minor capsid protein [Caudoviricetes sp.]
MRYPFTPEILDAIPEDLAELYRSLEATILEEICSRLKISGELNEVTVQDIRVLRSHGIDLSEIEKAIQRTANISRKELDKLLDEVVERNQRYYTDLIDLAGVTQPETLVSVEDTWAIYEQTRWELSNLTRSMGFLVDNGRTMLAPAKAYQWALDSAEMQVMSGAISYNQAIKGAVKQLAESGLRMVDYESGHRDHIDVAARRAVMTGVSQICAKYTEQSAEYLETPYFEVSAHIGARDKGIVWQNHKAWQGRVYSVRAEDKYPNIYEVCGLGYVDGLEGANCRHIRTVFVDGVMGRTYTDEELAHIDDGHDVDFEEKHYTAYEATQKQRQVERTIRKLKREQTAYKAAGLTEDAQAVTARIRRMNKEYKSFSEAAGLPLQRERMKVTYTDVASEQMASALKIQRDAEAPIRQAIQSGGYPLEINPEKQARHMAGMAIPGRSVITVSMEELQAIINAKAGSGKINFTDDFKKWKNTEIIDAGREIGYTINRNGDIIIARSIKIHYSKSGTHGVPFSGRWKK